MNETDWGRVAKTPCVSEYEVWLLARLEAEAEVVADLEYSRVCSTEMQNWQQARWERERRHRRWALERGRYWFGRKLWWSKMAAELDAAMADQRLLCFGLEKKVQAAEVACQSLLDQSSRWEAQALEAGVENERLLAEIGDLQLERSQAEARCAELEALVRRYQEKADALFRYTSAKPPKTDAMMAILTELSLEGEVRAALAESQEGKEER